MKLHWFGQAAFLLTGTRRVLIDPFGEMGERPFFPPMSGVEADVLLITHEHRDHNHAAAAAGDPVTVRSRAGTYPTPIGDVVAIASEHDAEAGIRRGPNTIMRFVLDDVRVAHFGDFGQAALRPAQAAALGAVDLLLVPVGGHFTIGAPEALELVRALQPRWVVPMHYRTGPLDFLDTADAFLAGCAAVERWDGPESELPGHPDGPPLTLVPAA